MFVQLRSFWWWVVWFLSCCFSWDQWHTILRGWWESEVCLEQSNTTWIMLGTVLLVTGSQLESASQVFLDGNHLPRVMGKIPHIPCRLPRTPASPSQLTRNSHLYTQVLAFVCIPQSGVAGSLNDYTLFRWLIAGKGGLVGHPGKTLRFPQGAGWWADIGGF